jgi:uncharacterized protein YkwD
VRGGVASICVLGVVAAITASGAASRPGHVNRVLTTREAALVAEINVVRSAHQLPRLRVDRRLVRAARSHSRDMLRHQYFAHGDFGTRIAQFGVRGHMFAENLVWGSGVMSASSDVAEWLASPPHRANLLDPNLRRVGVATPIGSFSGFSPATVVTADFAG